MRTIDARGHHCPVPTLRLRRALGEAVAGDVVRLLADDPMARIDVPHFCAEGGFELVSQTTDDPAVLTFIVGKPV
jgi:tRNA 2-thiouridine synthesizing protein A